jgi:hypothetical protein
LGNYLPWNRPKPDNHSTSWLKYITFEFRPTIPENVSEFLGECVNKSEILAKIEDGDAIALLLRVPLPLVGYEAFALTETQCTSFMALRDGLVASLKSTPGIQQLSTAAAYLAIKEAPEIHHRILHWVDMFSRTDFMDANSLSLQLNETKINK